MSRGIVARAALGTLGGFVLGISVIHLAVDTVDRDLKNRLVRMSESMDAAMTKLLP